MARVPLSPEHRRLIRFEREQCLRLSALTYLVINMTNTRIYMAQKGCSTTSIGVNMTKKRANFIKVTEALVKSVLKEMKDYE